MRAGLLLPDNLVEMSDDFKRRLTQAYAADHCWSKILTMVRHLTTRSTSIPARSGPTVAEENRMEAPPGDTRPTPAAANSMEEGPMSPIPNHKVYAFSIKTACYNSP